MATQEDADAIARVHWTAMRTSLPFLPELHDLEEVTAFVREHLLPANETWVAETAGEVVGYVSFHVDWIAHLYVHPNHQGRGVGPALLAKALDAETPRRLWTFQRNARARAFYEKRGFRLIELTDGSSNEEREPDALYEWRP